MLFGSKGLLGASIAAQGAHEFIAPLHDELDLLNHAAVRAWLLTTSPDVVINCTAYSQVDTAEDEPGTHFVFRASWLYGATGKNFFSAVRNWLQEERHLRIVSDQISTPNDVQNLARVFNEWLTLAKNSPASSRAFFNQHQGLYHLSAPRLMSRYAFAQRVALDLKVNGIAVKATMEAVPASSFSMKAKRPAYSGLISKKFEQQFDIEFEMQK